VDNVIDEVTFTIVSDHEVKTDIYELVQNMQVFKV